MPLLRGEDTELVRPYLVAFEEQRRKARLRGARGLVVDGVSAGGLRVPGAGAGAGVVR
ncbi:hypothetical protein ABZZ79_31295 [Streptomyces sp. NPDC006458]|uniref:hypothetical protein n=1 Tax=Streptomyces sp. NPDC006458 TaxID=3154302 RepID=UPI0033B0A03F